MKRSAYGMNGTFMREENPAGTAMQTASTQRSAESVSAMRTFPAERTAATSRDRSGRDVSEKLIDSNL
jgi:hypothetical protein